MQLATLIAFEPGLTLITGRIFPGNPPGDQIIMLAPETHAVLTDPWGNKHHAPMGSKPEHGPAGFQFHLVHSGLYSLDALGQTFPVPVLKDHVTHLTFYDATDHWPKLFTKLDQIATLLSGPTP